MSKFGHLLKEFRTARGLTKTALAERLRISSPYLFDLEEGKKKPPPLEKCEKLFDALGLTPDERERIKIAAQIERTPLELQDIFKNALKSASIPRSAIESDLFDKVPLLGECPCGKKTIVEENVEAWIPMPRSITKGRRIYLLRAKGDSMIGDGIREGDIVIVDADAQPNNGDVIVARIDDECTIKRFYKHGHHIVLHPANSAHQPIQLTEKNKFLYNGVVQGVLWKGLKK